MDQSLINKFSKYLATQPIEKAWVFGSYARNEEVKDSDIDVLVHFSKEFKITLFKYVHIVNELQLLTNKKVDLIEDGQLKQFAVKSAEHDKILIYERKTEG